MTKPKTLFIPHEPITYELKEYMLNNGFAESIEPFKSDKSLYSVRYPYKKKNYKEVIFGKLSRGKHIFLLGTGYMHDLTYFICKDFINRPFTLIYLDAHLDAKDNERIGKVTGATVQKRFPEGTVCCENPLYQILKHNPNLRRAIHIGCTSGAGIEYIHDELESQKLVMFPEQDFHYKISPAEYVKGVLLKSRESLFSSIYLKDPNVSGEDIGKLIWYLHNLGTKDERYKEMWRNIKSDVINVDKGWAELEREDKTNEVALIVRTAVSMLDGMEIDEKQLEQMVREGMPINLDVAKQNMTNVRTEYFSYNDIINDPPLMLDLIEGDIYITIDLDVLKGFNCLREFRHGKMELDELIQIVGLFSDSKIRDADICGLGNYLSDVKSFEKVGRVHNSLEKIM